MIYEMWRHHLGEGAKTFCNGWEHIAHVAKRWGEKDYLSKKGPKVFDVPETQFLCFKNI